MFWPKIYLKLTMICMLLALCAGCGVKVGPIHSFNETKPVDAKAAMVVGKIRFIVDGKPMQYSLLNRPLLRLYKFSDASYYESPMVNADGSFTWVLPDGGYEIAVLFGGMGPAGELMIMRNTGATWRVNGFTHPGYRLSAEKGEIHYLGALIVDVNSRKMEALIDFTGERVFDSLNGMTVADESTTDVRWQRLKDLPGAVIELFDPSRFQP